MNIKHKLLSDYQFISDDKIITLIKSRTIIEDYTYKNINLDKEIVNSNPQYFEILDWKNELLLFMKKSKIPQPAVLSKKLIPFINDMIVSFDKPVVVSSENDRERLKDRENELNIRIERLDRKEREYLEDIESLKRKETSYKNDLIILSNKEENLHEMQREFDLQILESIKNSDDNEKIDLLERKISESYKELATKEEEINDRRKQIEEYKLYFSDKIDEISNWQSIVLNNWNHNLYPIPNFPKIEKRDF